MDVNHVASTYMGIGRGQGGPWTPWILNILAKKVVFVVSNKKTQILPLLASPRKIYFATFSIPKKNFGKIP